MPSHVTTAFSYFGDAPLASVSVPLLGGTVAGDFEIVCFIGGATSWVAPAGWTFVASVTGTNARFFMYRRYHDASTGPWVFTPNVAVEYGSAARYVARDVSAAAPIQGLTSSFLGGAPSHAAPEVTSVVDGCLIVGLTFLEVFRVTTATTAGWTFRRGGVGQGGPVKLSDKQQATAGLTGTVTVTVDPATEAASFLMALQPGSYVPPDDDTVDPLSAVSSLGAGVMPVWTHVDGANPLIGWTDLSNASDTGMWVALTDYRADTELGDFYLAPGAVHAVPYAGSIIAKHVGGAGTKRIGVCRRYGIEE